MGMVATVLNAVALHDALESQGLEVCSQSALAVDRVCEPFDRRRCLKALQAGKIVILAGGTGVPFVTTDTCAAQRACELQAQVLLKATKVDGVYSADPQADPSARFYNRLTCTELIRQQLQIMDLAAVDLCRRNGIAIVVFNITQRGNLRRVLLGESVGTFVSAE